MSAVVPVYPATGERLAEYSTCSGADVGAGLDRAAQVQVGSELAAAGVRGFGDVRTWWVLDAPAATTTASE